RPGERELTICRCRSCWPGGGCLSTAEQAAGGAGDCVCVGAQCNLLREYRLHCGPGLSQWADGAWKVYPGAMKSRCSVETTLPCSTEVTVIYHLRFAEGVCHLVKMWQTVWQTPFPRTVHLERGLPQAEMIPAEPAPTVHLDLTTFPC